MEADEFRRHAHALVDWMADVLDGRSEGPVLPSVAPGEVRAAVAPLPPQRAQSFGETLAFTREHLLPAMTGWNRPDWFAYFPANNSPPSVLAEMMMATLGAQCMSWETSPAATELEEAVMDWLRRLCGLPDTWSGVIQDTASSATLVALLTARERATGWRWADEGPPADVVGRLVVYATAEAHSSVEKGVRLAGLGLGSLRQVPVREDRSMCPQRLAAMVAEDLDAGRLPVAVVATIGTTSCGAVDPIAQIAAVCRQHGVWLHVDGAWAGSAVLLEECGPLFRGLGEADSYVFNPHKWMLVNFDCSAYFVRDRDALLRTFAKEADYLRTQHDAQVTNYRDWGIPLGRRFRALKLYFVLQTYGVEGLAAILRRHCTLAADLRETLEGTGTFRVIQRSALPLLCVGMRGESAAQEDALTEALQQELRADGRAYLTPTRIGGRPFVRVSIGQRLTERAHVDTLAAVLREVGARIAASNQRAMGAH